MARTICGVDPGLGVTGYAVLRVGGESGSSTMLEGVTLVDAGVLRSDRQGELPDRLLQLEADFSSVLRDHQPDVVAVEELYAHTKHPRTSILMGHARGVILCAAARVGVPVASYPATRVKRHLTGNGHASKTQVQRAIRATLNLAAPPEPDDVADALAIALCCAGESARFAAR